MTVKSVAELSESWALRLVEVGAEISKGGCDVGTPLFSAKSPFRAFPT
jgi:hypothetical protein